MPYCLDYYSFIVNLTIRYVSLILFFFKFLLALKTICWNFKWDYKDYSLIWGESAL